MGYVLESFCKVQLSMLVLYSVYEMGAELSKALLKIVFQHFDQKLVATYRPTYIQARLHLTY